jgi:uncharacterized protein (TIGR03084 family)
VADLGAVLADLRAEGDELDALVAPLGPADWRRPTPAPGWTVAHQIAHLAWTDDIAILAATDPVAFDAVRTAAGAGAPDYVDRAAAERAGQPPEELLTGWRTGRTRLAAALAAAPPDVRMPWMGPPMLPVSMATARLMETWAHGLDVADALGVQRPAGDRLRHVAHLGVRTRDFAYRVHGRPAPADPFRVELAGPAGDLWAWGPADAPQQVIGPALDFCLLVTQRRHRADLGLVAVGPDADAWLDIAQVFAGPPGPGRAPGQFRDASG